MPVRRNYIDVVQDGRVRLENNTPITNFNAQGTAKGLLDVIGVEMERLYDDLEFVYRAIDPTRAAGADLDKIGYLVGENRNESVVASDYTDSNFFFYIDPRLNWGIMQLINNNYTADERQVLVANGFITLDTAGQPNSLIIPQGTLVENTDSTITYSLINDAVMTDSREVYVGVVAATAGPSSNVGTNVLINHSLSQIPELRRISKFIKSTNRFPIQNGRYSLTDEEFRYNISTARSAIRNNELSIRRAALSVPGIRDVFFEKNKFGNGTVSIMVDGVSPLVSQGLVDTVKQNIQQELSYGDVIFVNVPDYLGVEVSFGIEVDPTVQNEGALRQQARSAVIQYINDLPIGGEIVWNQIVSNVIALEGITDFIPTVFKYGEYDAFNKINRNQRVLRFVNQTAKFNEKWYSDSGLIQCCTV